MTKMMSRMKIGSQLENRQKRNHRKRERVFIIHLTCFFNKIFFLYIYSKGQNLTSHGYYRYKNLLKNQKKLEELGWLGWKKAVKPNLHSSDECDEGESAVRKQKG
jgi:hypothetical protein